MDFSLNEVQRSVRASAREIARSSLRPQAIVRHREATFPVDALQQLADHGLMGVNIDPEFGGLGAGVIAYSLAITEVAAADPAVAVTMAVNNMVSEVIQAFGTQAQKESIIPRLTSGEFSSGSFCLSEPGSGSDAAGMLTRAKKTDGGWLLQGTKAWITSGAFAGVFVVWAKTADDEISLFAVDPDLPGIEVGAPEMKTGQHASNTVTLSFDNVELSENALLGERGQGFPIAMMALDGGRIGIASQSLGIADAALMLADKNPHFSHDDLAVLTRLRADVEAARVITWRAAWLKEQNTNQFSREASMAKLTASEAAHATADQIYTRWPEIHADKDDDSRAFLEKLLRDVRVTRIYEGTSEIQRLVIARDLLRRGAR